ncbi:Hemerythrin domain-containing protein [Fusarium falciforme]|uniref:Hemerythrin domain-containing protein n=1 Tax=Fusarium falciforme TaxID=195108 RepID=UPI0023014F4D|nr:Hemerythrin domain-containing protein [Fusarium falciforme]WAO97340.1 Hemerythrin domain-containing protein [Fusarium falciforme]
MSLTRTLLLPQLRATIRPQHFRVAQFPLRVRIAAMSSVSDAIIKDHRELEQYYNEVINSADHDHQQRFGNQFVWELARHSIGEELVVYPAMERYMGTKGKEMAEHDRQEHHQVKELLKTFQGLSPQDSNYLPKLKEIWTLLSKHIEEEEGQDLPALEQALKADDGQSESMSNSFSRTKMFVPTRSHPSAGENPPFETVMGLMAAPMDRLADMFRKFPDQSKV